MKRHEVPELGHGGMEQGLGVLEPVPSVRRNVCGEEAGLFSAFVHDDQLPGCLQKELIAVNLQKGIICKKEDLKEVLLALPTSPADEAKCLVHVWDLSSNRGLLVVGDTNHDLQATCQATLWHRAERSRSCSTRTARMRRLSTTATQAFKICSLLTLADLAAAQAPLKGRQLRFSSLLQSLCRA